MRKFLTIIALSISLNSIPQFALTQSDDDVVQVQEALSSFLESFNNLDWDNFKTSFTDNASIFGFQWNSAGRKNLEESMFGAFPWVTDPSDRPGSPPYLNISPLDLAIEILGDTALVTFHLRRSQDPATLAQRTLLLVKQGNAWKIHHFHASIVSEG